MKTPACRKRNLLSIFFLFCGLILTAQNGNNDQVALLKTTTNKGDLQVFPNPATNFISVSDNDNVKKVLVFNLVGRKMKSYDAVKGEKYYVGDLPKGIYLVQLLGNKNQILRTQRVSKR